MTRVVDVSKYDYVIHREAMRRFDNNQVTGIEQQTDRHKARYQHLLGVAGEVAARIHLGQDPRGVERDQVGGADIVHNGIKYDVKAVQQHARRLNISWYPKLAEHKAEWTLLVMIYEGVGWRFMNWGTINYSELLDLQLYEPVSGHRNKHYSIDLDKWELK